MKRSPGASFEKGRERVLFCGAADVGIQFSGATVECTPASDDEIAKNLPLEMRHRLLSEHEVRALGGQ